MDDETLEHMHNLQVKQIDLNERLMDKWSEISFLKFWKLIVRYWRFSKKSQIGDNDNSKLFIEYSFLFLNS